MNYPLSQILITLIIFGFACFGVGYIVRDLMHRWDNDAMEKQSNKKPDDSK